MRSVVPKFSWKHSTPKNSSTNVIKERLAGLLRWEFTVGVSGTTWRRRSVRGVEGEAGFCSKLEKGMVATKLAIVFRVAGIGDNGFRWPTSSSTLSATASTTPNERRLY